MASRRTARDPDAPSFDHGCQMLSAEADLVPTKPWTHRLATIRGTTIDSVASRLRPVPTPRMNAPVAHRLQGIDASYATRICRIEHTDNRIGLQTDDTDLGAFDALIVTAPAPQTRELLKTAAPGIAQRAADITYDPNWTIMLERSADAEPLPFDAANVEGHPVAWLCHDSAKPGRARQGPQRWVVQFEAQFSRETIDQDPDTIGPVLLAAAKEHLGDAITPAQRPHRWRFAFVTRAVGEPCITEGPITAAGDWLLGNRAHHAARSGTAAAEALASTLRSQHS